MEQYIKKSALVAEIERKKIPFKRDVDDGVYPTYLCALMDFEDFINTLEVKEVDLEDAVDDAKDLAMRDMAWKVHVMISEGKSISEIDHYVCGICDF